MKTKVGDELNQQQVMDDIQAIYDQGFFSYVDAKVATDANGELVLTFVVTENPTIKEIRFRGNTIYKEDKLKKMLFTQPGMIFNRVFFRNDIQRLRERFQADGYVMTRVQDVQVEDGVVTVLIVEPRINDIVIQGNRRTKTYVIRRNIPLKNGDLFNSTLLRHSITKLRNLGFFEDVNVGFEPVEDSDNVDVIVTVKEKRSASLIFSVSYGSSSGLGGGASYRESNLGGRARIFEIGFDQGDYKNYWLSLSDPYMDKKTFSWKIGAYKREDDDLTYRYNGIV
ncbi:MAG: outer membrane protein assembly factor, partial [Pyramidobacter sp.]|nr:outer membrane protein assembly factor [Pyramidobacter sp.]